MAIVEDYKRLVEETKIEFSDFEILKKEDSGLMKAIDVVLKILTLGQMKTFMTGFITTLGNKVYVPSSWDTDSLVTRIEILRHERVHMRQAKKYGKLLFSILYLVIPLPCGLAYFRKKFEMEAYEESLRTLHFYMGKSIFTASLREFYVSQFVSANYFWTWPFRRGVEAWYDGVVEKILSGS